MAKFNPPAINSGYLSTEALNQALADVAEAFENTVSRDGTAPNQLEADLDMNSNRIFNLSPGITEGEPVTVGQLATSATGFVVQRQEIIDAAGGETSITFTSLSYTPESNNLGVYKNGVRLFVGEDFNEVDSSTILLFVPLIGSDTLVAVTNEFFGSLQPPASSFVPWSSVVGAPSFATRDPTWDEVTGKPATFPPSAHNHSATEITSGRLADPRRGVWVQASQPVGASVGDLWFW